MMDPDFREQLEREGKERRAGLSTPEPAPKPNDKPAVWDLVIADMRERDASGLAKYGTRLQPGNGRDALVDAYQEALDLCVYLRQAIAERELRAVPETSKFKIGNRVRYVSPQRTPIFWADSKDDFTVTAHLQHQFVTVSDAEGKQVDSHESTLALVSVRR